MKIRITSTDARIQRTLDMCPEMWVRACQRTLPTMPASVVSCCPGAVVFRDVSPGTATSIFFAVCNVVFDRVAFSSIQTTLIPEKKGEKQ